MKILIRAIITNKTDDERSDDEDEEGAEEGAEAKKED